MSHSSDVLEKLIGAVYRAAAEPILWESFLQQLARATGATSAGLVTRDVGKDVHLVPHFWGLDPYFPPLYQQHYHSLDVWGQRAWGKATGLVATSEELCPRATLTSTEIYNDFLVPSAVEHGIFILVDVRSNLYSSISLYRDSSCSPFEAAEIGFLRALSPHAECAFKLHMQFCALKAQTAGYETFLDMLPTAIVFLGAKGEVLHMNRSASVLLSERDGLLLTQDGLRTELQSDAGLLRKTVRQAVSRSGLRAGGIALISRRTGPPLQVLVSPIRHSALSTSQPIHAIVFVVDPAKRQRPSKDILRMLFGLTPAECRVALYLGGGQAPKEIASTLAVSIDTVRSQMKSIFSKTGVSRQSELVRLLIDRSVLDMDPE